METRRGKISTSQSQTLDKPALVLTQNKIMLQTARHPQCAQTDDKFYHVFIRDPYKNDQLIQSLPILVDYSGAEPGLYTYIVMSVGLESPKLYMIKTITIYEYGTKHHQMIYRIACGSNVTCNRYRVFYAGEMQVTEPGKIMFNFYSGTYMIKPTDNAHRLVGKKKMDTINYMTNYLHNLGYSDVEFTENPLLTSDALPLSRDDLELYKSYGAVIREFDSYDTCREFHALTKQRADIPTHIIQQSRLIGGRLRRVRNTQKKRYY